MKLIDNISLEEYNNFVKNNTYCNIFQSPQWTDIKDTWGYKRLAVINNNKIIATAQILTRKGLWYLPRGPIMDYNDTKLLEFFLEELKKYAKKNNSKMLKIDIPLPLKKAKLENYRNEEEDNKKSLILNIFKKSKFKHKGFTQKMSETIQPRFEMISHLSENYFSELPKHTKRLLKDVEKRYVTIRKCDISKLDDFMFTLSCTEKRKGITLRKKEYFEKLFDIYKDDCVLYIAYLDVLFATEKVKKIEEEIIMEISNLKEHMHKRKRVLEERLVGTRKLIEFFTQLSNENSEKKEQIICAAISLKYGKYSEMIYAGMNYKFSKIPAQYKIYVETMLKFYEMGAKETSMGGVEGSLDDGLTLFKSHFNADVVEHYGEFDYVISPMFKLMYDYGLPLRRKILSLLK